MNKESKNPVQIDLKEEAKKEENKDIQPGMIKDVKVTIGGRELVLVYNMRVQMKVEEEMEMDFAELQEKLNKAKRSSKAVIGIIRLMGNEGLRRDGKEPDLTEEWLADHMQPGFMLSYRIAAISAITAGWFMETDNSYNEEQDVTLNEIRKKNASTD